METQDDVRMEEKIRELENRISQLRAGRRILMTLLEQSTQEKMRQIVRLEKENQILRKQNRRYATQLMLLKTGAKCENPSHKDFSNPFA